MLVPQMRQLCDHDNTHVFISTTSCPYNDDDNDGDPQCPSINSNDDDDNTILFLCSTQHHFVHVA